MLTLERAALVRILSALACSDCFSFGYEIVFLPLLFATTCQTLPSLA